MGACPHSSIRFEGDVRHDSAGVRRNEWDGSWLSCGKCMNCLECLRDYTVMPVVYMPFVFIDFIAGSCAGPDPGAVGNGLSEA